MKNFFYLIYTLDLQKINNSWIINERVSCKRLAKERKLFDDPTFPNAFPVELLKEK